MSKQESNSVSSHYEGKSQVIVGSYNEAPDYIKDNKYIKKGYRINCDSVIKVTKSLFVFHNETVNIWSHIIGAITAIVLIGYTAIFITSYSTQLKNLTNHFHQLKSLSTNIDQISFSSFSYTISNLTSDFFSDIGSKLNLSSKYQNYIDGINNSINKLKNNTPVIFDNLTDSLADYFEDISEKLSSIKQQLLELVEMEELTFEKGTKKSVNGLKRWPLFVMLASAVLCLGFSATFHTFNILSKKIHSKFSRLDYAGISLLIAGSCYPPYYYFFHCEQFLKIVYLVFITVFSVSVFLYSLTSDFHTPKRKPLRGWLFLTLGISAGIPVLHMGFFGSTIRGYDTSPRLLFWYIGGISYIVGALLFIKRIPERLFPGRFDFFGNSHNLFHLLIVVGVITHYIGCLDAYYYRFYNTCPAV